MTSLNDGGEMGNTYLLLTSKVRKAFWFITKVDCNFTFYWIGRKWALPHYIVKLVFVLNTHPSEQSEPLTSELLDFFTGSWRLSAQSILLIFLLLIPLVHFFSFLEIHWRPGKMDLPILLTFSSYQVNCYLFRGKGEFYSFVHLQLTFMMSK